MTNYIHRTIAIRCEIPSEIQSMLGDFRLMVNWLISWGLYVGRPKNPNRKRYWLATKHGERFDRYQMCNDTTEWFENAWHSKYAAHYHEAACSYASQQLKSSTALGGNTSCLPYLNRPMARLRNDLFRVDFLGERDISVRIVLEPHHFVGFRVSVFHRLLQDYRVGSAIGELAIFEDKLNLVFRLPDKRVRARKNAGMDTNFSSIEIALEDRIEHVSLEKVVEIQRRYRDIRKKIRRAIPKNLSKQWKVLARRSNREHNKVEGVIQKEVVPEIIEKTEGYNIAWDDLKTTSLECVISGGKRFNERLSSWIHGRIQTITDNKSPNRPMERIFTLGSSSWCPFCGSKLAHPEWSISLCSNCGMFDRDSLSAIADRVRSMYRHKKGEPWKLAKEVLPMEQVAALSKAALLVAVPTRMEQALHDLTREKRGYGEFPSQGGGLALNAASSAGRETASLTRSTVDSESPLGEVGLENAMTLSQHEPNKVGALK